MPPRTSPLASLSSGHERLHVPSAAERVAHALREQIVDGQLAPGVRLTEEVVGSLLGVSRNTVREALAMLVVERLCERKANRGVFVVVPTLAGVRGLYDYRILTESAALAWGPPLTDAALAPLRRAVSDAHACARAEDWVGVATANQRFHRGVAALSGSDTSERYFAVALAEMRLAFACAGDPQWQGIYVARNADVLTLLERGLRDEAAAELRRYLTDAREDLVRRLAVLGHD